MASVADLIHGSYITIFNRAADPQGALFWSQNLGFTNIGAAAAAPGSLALADQLGANFYAAAGSVFNTLYPTTIFDSEFIDAVYTNLGNSPADLQGAAFWGNRLMVLEGDNPGNPQLARAIVASEIAFVLQTFDPTGQPQSAIDRSNTYKNKLAVSEAIVATGNPVFNPASQSLTDPAYLGASDILTDINASDASRAAALSQVAAANAANNPALLIKSNHPLTLTIGVDAFTTSFNDALFSASPAWNLQGQQFNTLNAGDNLQDTGTNGTLHYTAVASLLSNPALAAGVTMNGIANANILNTSAGVAGFSGNIAGLTTAKMLAGSNGNVQLGLASAGLN